MMTYWGLLGAQSTGRVLISLHLHSLGPPRTSAGIELRKVSGPGVPGFQVFRNFGHIGFGRMAITSCLVGPGHRYLVQADCSAGSEEQSAEDLWWRCSVEAWFEEPPRTVRVPLWVRGRRWATAQQLAHLPLNPDPRGSTVHGMNPA